MLFLLIFFCISKTKSVTTGKWSDHENIYRVTSEFNVESKVEKLALTPFRLAEDLSNEFPEVVLSTNMFFTDPADINDVSSVKYEGEVYEIPDITLSGPNFFELFDYPFIEGNPDSALKKDWYWLTCYTYVKLKEEVDIENLTFRFNEYAENERRKLPDDEELILGGYFVNKFEPISNVHFNTELQYDSPSNIDISFLYIFGIIAAFILLTASINYINLATARSLKRAKEIGVRKVIGAHKRQLVFQHISESIILTFISFILAMTLVESFMPQFNLLVGKNLTLVGSIFSGEGIFFGVILFFIILILAVIGGSFPAFVLTSFKPASVLKGNYFISDKLGKQQLSAGLMRRFLVTVQYIVSICMIISTFIVYSQMDFLKSYDLGFEDENIVVINTPDDTTFIHRLTQLGSHTS